MDTLFTKLIGTLAVILVIAAIIGGSDFMNRLVTSRRDRKYTLLAGVLGGMFGIYGNIAGVSFSGAVISVRDIGPMLSGFVGGPWGGLLGGITALPWAESPPRPASSPPAASVPCAACCRSVITTG